MDFIIIGLGGVVVFVAIYMALHYLFPSWGTVMSNGLVSAVTAGLVILEQVVGIASGLPWDAILGPEQAKAVLFAITAGNAIIRVMGPKNPVGSGK